VAFDVPEFTAESKMAEASVLELYGAIAAIPGGDWTLA
jgi:hypothetical protein